MNEIINKKSDEDFAKDFSNIEKENILIKAHIKDIFYSPSLNSCLFSYEYKIIDNNSINIFYTIINFLTKEIIYENNNKKDYVVLEISWLTFYEKNSSEIVCRSLIITWKLNINYNECNEWVNQNNANWKALIISNKEKLIKIVKSMSNYLISNIIGSSLNSILVNVISSQEIINELSDLHHSKFHFFSNHKNLALFIL